MLKIEAQLDNTNYSDVTARLVRGSLKHGGSTANPDRPTPKHASGYVILTGLFSTQIQRMQCRISYDTNVLWNGWLQEPQRLPNQQTRWHIASTRSEIGAQQIAVSTPSVAASAALGFSAITNRAGTITPRYLPNRMLRGFQYEGPLTGLISRLALLNSAELVETRTGALAAVNPHLTAVPVGATIDAASTLILNPRSQQLANRIRNVGRTRIPATTTGADSTWSIDIDIPNAATGPLTATVQLPDDGATYSAFEASATAEVRLPLTTTETWQRVSGANVQLQTSLAASSTENGWLTVPATVTLGTPVNGMVPVTVTVTPPATYQRTIIATLTIITYANSQQFGVIPSSVVVAPDGARINANRVVGSQLGNAETTPTPSMLRATVTVRATRTVTTAVAAVNFKVTDGASVAVWGERELALPDWILVNRSNGNAAISEQIEGLAALRSVHEVTMPLSEAAAQTVDAGQYVFLQVADDAFDAHIQAWCVVVERRLDFGDGRLDSCTIRCLETALAAVVAPGVPQSLTASAVDGDIDLRWLPPVTGSPATSYEVRYRVAGASAWSDAISMGLAFTGTLTGLTPATEYQIQIRAINGGGTSAWSAIATATTQAGGDPTPPPASTVGVAPRIRYRLTSRTQYWYSINNPTVPSGYRLQRTQWRVQQVGEAFSRWMNFSDWIRLNISEYGTTPQSFIVQARHQWRERGGSARPFSPIAAIAGPPSSSEETSGPQYLTLDGQPLLLQNQLLEVENEDDI